MRFERRDATETVRTHSLAGALDFSSNDYLALATNPQVVEAFRRATRVGSGGARLLGGSHREHSLLEEELAAWLGRERVLLFSSGYHAALGAIAYLRDTVERDLFRPLESRVVDRRDSRCAHRANRLRPRAASAARGSAAATR